MPLIDPAMLTARFSGFYFATLVAAFLFGFVLLVVGAVLGAVSDYQREQIEKGVEIPSWLGRLIARLPPELPAALVQMCLVVALFAAVIISVPGYYRDTSGVIIGSYKTDALTGLFTGMACYGAFRSAISTILSYMDRNTDPATSLKKPEPEKKKVRRFK